MVSDCKNVITLIGAATTIEELIACEFSAEKYLPTPAHEDSDRSWIDWRYANWGTKRMSYFKVLQKGVRGCIFSNISTRGPPIAFFKFLQEKFPDLQIKCEFNNQEDGFGGIWIGRRVNGEVEITSHHWVDFDEDEYYEAFESNI